MLCGQLDLHSKGDEIQDYLKEITGRLPDPAYFTNLASFRKVLGALLRGIYVESSGRYDSGWI